MGDGGGFSAEFSGQGLDRPGWHTAFCRCPFGSFRDAVFLSEDILGDLVHAYGMGCHVFFVVSAFGQPHIDDRQLQSGISVG